MGLVAGLVSPMASRGRPRPRRDPLEPPWWFDLLLTVAAAVVVALLVWPAGWAAHCAWQLFLHGWQAA